MKKLFFLWLILASVVMVVSTRFDHFATFVILLLFAFISGAIALIITNARQKRTPND